MYNYLSISIDLLLPILLLIILNYLYYKRTIRFECYLLFHWKRKEQLLKPEKSSKNKHIKKVLRYAGGDKGYAPSTAPPFEKGGRKLFSFYHCADFIDDLRGDAQRVATDFFFL